MGVPSKSKWQIADLAFPFAWEAKFGEENVVIEVLVGSEREH